MNLSGFDVDSPLSRFDHVDKRYFSVVGKHSGLQWGKKSNYRFFFLRQTKEEYGIRRRQQNFIGIKVHASMAADSPRTAPTCSLVLENIENFP